MSKTSAVTANLLKHSRRSMERRQKTPKPDFRCECLFDEDDEAEVFPDYPSQPKKIDG